MVLDLLLKPFAVGVALVCFPGPFVRVNIGLLTFLRLLFLNVPFMLRRRFLPRPFLRAMIMQFLTTDQLRFITGKKRYSAQRRALARMGISFIQRPDGMPIVDSSTILPVVAICKRQSNPDFSSLNASVSSQS
jgi:hypothetical protein